MEQSADTEVGELQRRNYFRQRGIYLTIGDACVINSIRKAELCHQLCPERLAAKHKTSVPLVLCPRSSGA
jgi:hypothetical protein